MRKLLLMGLFTAMLFGQKIYKADISSNQVAEMINKGATILDVRTPPEWHNLGIIPKSKLVMFFDNRGNYNLNAFMKELNKQGISKSDNIIVICRSGNRSVHVSNMLTDRGYKNIYNVKKGIKGWIRAGKKVTKNF
jgi:rhodanese-related sulfurtransferase